jgi:uncharacterized membrane protein
MKQYIGIALVVAGALLLGISFLMGWTSSNIVLLVGLILIICGAYWHVSQQKKREKY